MPQYTPLAIGEIKLGMLVTNPQYPYSGSLPLAEKKPIKHSSISLRTVIDDEQDSKASDLGARLLELLSFNRSKEKDLNIKITGRVTSHRLNDYVDWFAEAIQDEETQKWIERKSKSGGIYLAVEYQTVRNAQVSEEQTAKRAVSGTGKMPISTLIGTALCVILPSDAVDPSAGFSRQRDRAAKVDYEVEGESVFAVTYRLLKINEHASNVELSKTMWKRYSALRTSKSTTDDKSILEVAFEDDPEKVSAALDED